MKLFVTSVNDSAIEATERLYDPDTRRNEATEKCGGAALSTNRREVAPSHNGGSNVFRVQVKSCAVPTVPILAVSLISQQKLACTRDKPMLSYVGITTLWSYIVEWVAPVVEYNR